MVIGPQASGGRLKSALGLAYSVSVCVDETVQPSGPIIVSVRV